MPPTFLTCRATLVSPLDALDAALALVREEDSRPAPDLGALLGEVWV